MRRVGVLALFLVLLLSPSSVGAEGGIAVLDSSVEADFPAVLTFSLEVESRVDIVDARVHYQVDKMNYAQVTSEAWADFVPETRVKTSLTWDMRKASLPPGASITYWWTVEDAAGNSVETPHAVLSFDDDRYDWRSLADGALTLFWYEGDDSFAGELMTACEEGLGRLTREVGTYPEKLIRIYVYASASDLQGAMIFPQEWTGGTAFTEFGIVAIGISPDQLDWGRRAMVHV
jgi:hypothetical protein